MCVDFRFRSFKIIFLLSLCYDVSRKSYLFVSVMFSGLVSDLLVLCINVPDVCFTVSVSLMGTVGNVAVGGGVVIQYPPSYFVDEYILR